MNKSKIIVNKLFFVQFMSATIYFFVLINQIGDDTTKLGKRCFTMDSELGMEVIAIGYIIISWSTMINNAYNLEMQVQKMMRNRPCYIITLHKKLIKKLKLIWSTWLEEIDHLYSKSLYMNQYFFIFTQGLPCLGDINTILWFFKVKNAKNDGFIQFNNFNLTVFTSFLCTSIVFIVHG